MSIPRKKPLQRGAPPQRSGRPRAKNVQRAKANHDRAYGPKAVWIRTLECCITGCAQKPIQAAHTASGGMGRKSGSETLVPLCGFMTAAGHHDELHQVGVQTFQAKYSIDLKLAAAAYEREWQSRLASEDHAWAT